MKKNKNNEILNDDMSEKNIISKVNCRKLIRIKNAEVNGWKFIRQCSPEEKEIQDQINANKKALIVKN